MNPSALMSIFIPTNVVPSSPSLTLVKQSLDSIKDAWPLSGATVYIHCDLPNRPKPIEYQYLFNLLRFSRQSDVKTIIFSTIYGGLKRGYIKLIKKIETPFVLVWEHDWRFIRGRAPSIDAILRAFQKHNFINYIRFNKRKNQIAGWDQRLKPEPRCSEVSLLKTWNISNNPHIARTNIMREEWINVLRRDKKRLSPGRNAGAWGVEDAYNKKMDKDVQKYGFTKAHDKWGTYLYGDLGHPAIVKHVDGRRARWIH